MSSDPDIGVMLSFNRSSDEKYAITSPVTLKVPSTSTLPLAFTFKIGTPDKSATEKISPVKLSVTENN